MTELEKEKYNAFLTEVSDILGLEKPVNILKLCAITDNFIKPYQERIAELEKENEELIQENEEMKKSLGCETCQIHLEYTRLNNKIAELEKENAGLKACNESKNEARSFLARWVDNRPYTVSEHTDLIADTELFLSEAI